MAIEGPLGVHTRPVFDNVLSNTQVHRMNEFGGKKDTIESGKKEKEGWGSCATRWLCFVPNLMWLCVKKVLCVLTLGYCCTDKTSPKEMKKGLEGVIGVWKKDDASKEDKESAWKDFCKKCPGAKEEMVTAYVKAKEDAAVGGKATAAERKQWQEDHGNDLRKRAEARMENQDVDLLESYIGALEVRANEADAS